MPPSTFPAYLHIRDFIDSAEPDPTRPGKGLALQLRVSLNIPEKDVHSDDVEQNDIPTIIRFFCEPNRTSNYQENTFIYAWGSFLTDVTPSEDFHILLLAHAVDRHPGNHEDTDSYFMHCPDAAQPVVTFLGNVTEREGELNGNTSMLLHYRLQSTVYNSSSRSHHTFPVTAYFKNGPRWANFPPLTLNTAVFITGRIFGTTKENRQLAVITEDIHFLPVLAQAFPPSPSSTTGKRKRPDRWAQRATPVTPSKSARLLTDSLQSNQTELGTSPPPQELNETIIREYDNTSPTASPDIANETASPPLMSSPTPERRSQRKPKTSYVDILAQSYT